MLSQRNGTCEGDELPLQQQMTLHCNKFTSLQLVPIYHYQYQFTINVVMETFGMLHAVVGVLGCSDCRMPQGKLSSAIFMLVLSGMWCVA